MNVIVGVRKGGKGSSWETAVADGWVPGKNVEIIWRSAEGQPVLVIASGSNRVDEKKVEVTPDTPVVTYVSGDKSDLKAGAQVIAFTKKLPDGSLEADRIGVGRDGLTPPM